MSIRKSYLFPDIYQEIAQFSFALCHPARLCIIDLIRTKAPCPCPFAVLEFHLPLSQATISYHVQVLKERGLIRSAILPTGESGYCLTEQGLALGAQQLAHFASETAQRRSPGG